MYEMQRSKAAEVADRLHKRIDIRGHRPLGIKPHEESTYFGIPNTLRGSISNEDYYKYYEPRVVSIGPLYYGKPHLAAMENYKRIAVRYLLLNLKNMLTIEQVYADVEQELLKAKKFYNDKSWEGDDIEWCMMMMLDGCFIIDFICTDEVALNTRTRLNIMKKHDRHLVRRDLLLLENQLPFHLLNVLAQAFKCKEFTKPLLTKNFLKMPLLKIYCASTTPKSTNYTESVCQDRLEAEDPAHLLQYYRDLWINVLFENDVRRGEDDFAVSTPSSIIELKKIGIRCSCAMGRRNTIFSPEDIHFKLSGMSGKLFLPQLTIDEWTVSLFLNILANGYSCSTPYNTLWSSSYLSFLCSLIDGEEDVKELRARGILQVNYKFGDDQVVNFLKNITPYNESTHSAIRKVKQQISTYNKSRYTPLREAYAEFKQRYFSGTWSFLVFLAVIFTVAMTVIQTVLTGIQTYK